MTALPYRNEHGVWFLGARPATVDDVAETALALDRLHAAAVAELERLRAEMLAGVEAPVLEAVDERQLTLDEAAADEASAVEPDGGKRASPRAVRRVKAHQAPSVARVRRAFLDVRTADEFRICRLAHGWFQHEVAHALGLPPSVVKRVERLAEGLEDSTATRNAWTRADLVLEGLRRTRGEAAA